MKSEQEHIRDGLLRPFKRFILGPNAAVTGIAPVQAVPTTAAQWAIINKSVVDANAERSTFAGHVFLEELGVYLTSGTPGLGASVWVAPFLTPVSGTMAAGMSVANAHGGSATSVVVAASAVTVLTPAAPTWYPLNFSWDPVTAAAFSTGYNNAMFHRHLNGRISIPPSCGLAIAVVGPAGTNPLYAPFAIWTEQQAAVS